MGEEVPVQSRRPGSLPSQPHWAEGSPHPRLGLQGPSPMLRTYVPVSPVHPSPSSQNEPFLCFNSFIEI